MNPKPSIPPILIGLLLTACAHQPKPTTIADKQVQSSTHQTLPAVASQDKDANHSSEQLAFIHYFSALTLEEQKTELAGTLQNISTHRDELHQKTRAVIIYSIPGSKLRDPLKAQPLLDELTREKRLSKEDSAIVSILRDHAAETAKLNQRLREEQKRSDESQQKANALQQKLDELKKIERTMMQKSLKDPNRSSSK